MAHIGVLLIILLLLHRLRCGARRRALRANAMARRSRLHRFMIVSAQDSIRFCAFLLARRSMACQTRRAIWMKPRNNSFLTDVVKSWTDSEFKQNFRVSRTTYAFLCRELQDHLQRQCVVRDPLSVEQRVAISLWRLGTNVEYRTISHLFGVGVSTVCVVLHEFCSAVVNNMTAKYINIPAGEHLRRIINGFLTSSQSIPGNGFSCLYQSQDSPYANLDGILDVTWKQMVSLW